MPTRNRAKKSELPRESEASNNDTLPQEDSPASASMEDDGNASSETIILQAIEGLKTEFSNKLDGVISAVNGLRGELSGCKARITETEERISTAEDDVTFLKNRCESLEGRVVTLTSKLDSYENRSRRSNLRLVNLPESAEGSDTCAFLERWLPEALGLPATATPMVIELAHRISAGPKLPGNAPPRPLIMKFLNYRDKVRVQDAARRKGKILYNDRQVMLFPDVSAELHKQRRKFDEVKRKLRELNVQYGIVFPARLRVTHSGRSHFFDNPKEAEIFITKIRG